MKNAHKVMTALLWGLTLVATTSFIIASVLRYQRVSEADEAPARVMVLSDNREPDGSLPVLAQVPEFQFVDQDAKPLTRDALLGRVHIASFVFTNCPGPCPLITQRQAALQEIITDPGVHMLSFTVDPENDTPAVLKQYAKHHKVDESRWRFLTGDSDAIYSFARGMLVTVVPARGEDPIVHTEKYVLVDAQGQIRGYYGSRDDESLTQLVSDARQLAREIRN